MIPSECVPPPRGTIWTHWTHWTNRNRLSGVGLSAVRTCADRRHGNHGTDAATILDESVWTNGTLRHGLITIPVARPPGRCPNSKNCCYTPRISIRVSCRSFTWDAPTPDGAGSPGSTQRSGSDSRRQNARVRRRADRFARYANSVSAVLTSTNRSGSPGRSWPRRSRSARMTWAIFGYPPMV